MGENCSNCGFPIVLVKCSRCSSEYYCSQLCQIDHWDKHQSICDSIDDDYALGESLMDFAKEIKPELLKRGIDPKYIKVAEVHQIRFIHVDHSISKKRSNASPVEATVRGICLHTFPFQFSVHINNTTNPIEHQRLERCFEVLTEPLRLMGSRKYTKFTYFLQICLTMKSLSCCRNNFALDTRRSSLSRKSELRQLGYFEKYGTWTLPGIPGDNQITSYLLKLRKWMIEFVGNLSVSNLEVFGSSKRQQEIWVDLIKRMKTVTNETQLVEYFPNLLRRAYNVGYGELIVVTLRRCCDLNAVNGLMTWESSKVLLIHELTHTLCYTQTDTQSGSDPTHSGPFQSAEVFMFGQAWEQGHISRRCSTYPECEMYLRETHQNSTFGLSEEEEEKEKEQQQQQQEEEKQGEKD